ncbi:HAD family hydrolase [Allorhodopirellula solitaria]|uniref:Haloacid dehalogenase-like hydrolase n=1 Tax=Allorhodopirellula solitaria TaxID=2527987 RepID=A0A5C5YDZ1_9BACT|nr:HAD family hydrolase [Allorhodopirellula solitaria]TWT73198.1 haloacid dehalogenase-like hydrolase [Allorhodopirellula solitaria]
MSTFQKLQLFSLTTVAAFLVAPLQAADPLPSWNDGTTKQSIVDFVNKVTEEGSGDFVPVAERIAVFDNDGTLWSENPLPFQVIFAAAEIKRLLPEHPEWNDNAAVQAFIKSDVAALTANHNKGLLEVLALTHAGMSTDAYDQRVKDWLATAEHPRWKKPYSQCVYQPMIELLEYLRANDFQTWIVSGGGLSFMRVLSEQTYGIPPQQVIGSHGQATFEMKDGVPTLTKTLETVFVDDKAGKPAGIYQFIGRRPIAAFGNSDGDQAMLEYTTIDNPRPSFGMIIHHTDAEREYAYDAKPKSSGKLITALEAAPTHGWTVVDMKKDWETVLAE